MRRGPTMREKLTAVVIIFGLLVCAASVAEAQATVKLLIGTETLDRDWWSPVHKPLDIGAAIVVPLTGTGILAEFGVLALSDSGSALDPGGSGLVVDAKMSGTELFAGLGYEVDITPQGNQYASISGGILQISVKMEVEIAGLLSVSDDDTSLGFYLALGGGVRSGALDFAAVVRLRLNTDISLFSLPGDVDGTALLLTLGYSF